MKLYNSKKSTELWVPSDMPFWIIFAVVLGFTAVLFLWIITPFIAKTEEIPESVESYILVQRFINSPNCFAQDKYLARDLVWIVMPILEANRQTNRQFLAHSSAVERDGRGVVFFGQTHSGKSLL